MAASNLSMDAKSETSAMSAIQKQVRIEEIKDRVEAIKEMDKTQLTKEDRVALKEELKNMKHEARVIRGGVFISAGALIVIIILLIIIL